MCILLIRYTLDDIFVDEEKKYVGNCIDFVRDMLKQLEEVRGMTMSPQSCNDMTLYVVSRVEKEANWFFNVRTINHQYFEYKN